MHRLSTLLPLLLTVALLVPAPARAAGADPYLADQWQESDSGIAALRAAGADGRGITIGIVDGGFDLEHEDLDGIALTYLPPADGEPFMPAHGTGVLGVLAAEYRNGRGIAGIVPRARVIAHGTGVEDDERLLGYLEELADRGARVISISLGYEAAVRGTVLERAYAQLRDRGVLVVAAAGNYGEAEVRIYPSRLNSVLSIGAHDRTGAWASFSIRTGVALSAPGVEIPATRMGGGYSLRSGTSLSTPIVTGTIAALMSLDPSLPSEAIVALLVATARRSVDGPPRIDAAAALARLRSGEPLARITELPKTLRTSRGQLVTVRSGRLGATGDCQVVLSLSGTELTRGLCGNPISRTLGELIDVADPSLRSGDIEVRLEGAGVEDRGLIPFDLDEIPFDPEPEDLSAPRLAHPLGAPWIAGVNGVGSTEARISDNRGLRYDGVYCEEIASRLRTADGATGPWKRHIDETVNFPYRLEGRSMILPLPEVRALAPGRIEWRIECTDTAGNFAPTTIATVAVPFEGAALTWDAGGYLLPYPGARGGDLSVTTLPASIERSGFGSRLALIGSTGPGFGALELTIDGRASCTIDLGRYADGRERPARNRVTLLGPGSRCGDVVLAALSSAATTHTVTLRALPIEGRRIVPIDAIAFW